MRIAAVSDIHYNKESRGKEQELFRAVCNEADAFLMCGDLTDHGHEEEARVLAEDLHTYSRIPMIGILGNHDYESGEPEKVRTILEEAGVKMLDGESLVLDGIGFAGVCGFAGGFDRWSLNPWGEPVIKQFVQVTVEEVLKLESALTRLETEKRIVLLHYSPIRQTVEGECPEIFPFLGSSRLEDPLNHYDVTAAFHGHAHHGTAEGKTSKDIPVYNVSLPVLREAYPDRLPFRIFEA
jgi:Icc-related predicted phosphoesterase